MFGGLGGGVVEPNDESSGGVALGGCGELAGSNAGVAPGPAPVSGVEELGVVLGVVWGPAGAVAAPSRLGRSWWLRLRRLRVRWRYVARNESCYGKRYRKAIKRRVDCHAATPAKIPVHGSSATLLRAYNWMIARVTSNGPKTPDFATALPSQALGLVVVWRWLHGGNELTKKCACTT